MSDVKKDINKAERDVWEKALEEKYDENGDMYVVDPKNGFRHVGNKIYPHTWDEEKAAKWAAAVGIPMAAIGALAGRRLKRLTKGKEGGALSGAALLGGTSGALAGLLGGQKRINKKDRKNRK